jgi:hypothetical protein
MGRSKNGKAPQKTTAQVATELRGRLEEQLGHERTEAIWRDPTATQEVLENEGEAASVAGIVLQALKELPEEEAPPERKRRSGFRRGLRLVLIAAIAFWAVAMINKARQTPEA